MKKVICLAAILISSQVNALELIKLIPVQRISLDNQIVKYNTVTGVTTFLNPDGYSSTCLDGIGSYPTDLIADPIRPVVYVFTSCEETIALSTITGRELYRHPNPGYYTRKAVVAPLIGRLK